MTDIQPTLREAVRRAGKGGRIAVWMEVSADTETPVSAFLKIRRPPWGFLFESVEGGERVGRYSFLGAGPSAVFTARGNILEEAGGGKRTVRKGNPLELLRKRFAQLRGRPRVDAPRFEGGTVRKADEFSPRFGGGLVGYAGYDSVRYMENLRRPPKDVLDLPEMLFMLQDDVLVFDRVRHTIRIIAHEPAGNNAARAYAEASRRVDAIRQQLASPAPAPASFNLKGGIPPLPPSNMSRKKFEAGVRRAKEYIRQGDIIQVVLSQRFSVPFEGDAFSLYRSLRMLNPSPYMFFIECGELSLAGSSPELLVRLEGDEVETRPIAGTRPRGQNSALDERLERDLLADPKEKAEHVMLVDLGRNDLGRVCRYGTVRVDEHMIVERYSHVMHLVSSVKGKLEPGHDAFDVFRACFPAGTVSGAPKVRAMEIIDELEPSKRGPYAGAVGYFGFSGNMDTAIAIRTITVTGGRALVQTGMGIVADSVPAKEYEESLAKARASLLAISAVSGAYPPRRSRRLRRRTRRAGPRPFGADK